MRSGLTFVRALLSYSAVRWRYLAAPTVFVDAEDVEPIRNVLDGLAESFSGGVPWVAVTPAERQALERLISRLSS